eukprot:Tbor_TRINITY_DN5846_c0_g7::TRINITY_DN5846_c0_g7_i1::g.7190::m.7190
MKAILDKTFSRRPSSYMRIPSLGVTDSMGSLSSSNSMYMPLSNTTSPASSSNDLSSRVINSRYTFPSPREKTTRECKIENLSNEVFSEGSFYIKGALELESLPEGTFSFPEIALIGKPNVGKSSIISALLHNPKIGKVGKNRGTTRILNFINVGDAFLLVDTPGYGTWDFLKERRFKMSEAHGALFQYLAARSRGNLRHVYWVFEGKKQYDNPSRRMTANHWTPCEREKEILRFLEYERIPFTAILNKADFYVDKGGFNRLSDDVCRLYDFFGTDLIPVLHTTSRLNEQRNISMLQHDIMSHVCNQLPDEHLTMRHLKELSYIPLSAEEQIRIEERYPKSHCIIPQKDEISMKKFILDHERAKLSFIEYKRFDADIKVSMHQLEKGMHQTLINFPEYLDKLSNDFEEDTTKWDIERDGLLNDILLASNTPKKDFTTLASANNEGSNSLLLSCDLIDDEVSNAQMTSESPKEDITAINEEVLADGSFSNSTSKSLVKDRPHKNSLIFKDENVQCKPSILSYPRGISPAFPQKFLPGSLVDLSQARRAALVPRSFDAFKVSCQDHAQNIERAYTEKGDTATPFFQEKSSGSITHLSQKSKMIIKYIVGKKNPRPKAPTCAQFMAPWLGKEKESRLVGITDDVGEPPSATGGSIMLRLKSSGFGGRSVSPNSMKRRGRATPKAFKWHS